MGGIPAPKHVRQKYEHAEVRRVLWRVVITVLRLMHGRRFPNRRFGSDLQLLIVYGSAVMTFLEGKTVRVSTVARFLDMPHETVRRHLRHCVELGLFRRANGHYEPTIKIQNIDLNKQEKLLEGLADPYIAQWF